MILRWKVTLAPSRPKIKIHAKLPVTAPSAHGVLVIDEHGDRKAGTHIAHVGRQYLGNLGRVDIGFLLDF